MDPTPLVQLKLEPADKCITCMEAGLVQDWLKSTRYVALIQSTDSAAIFVYTSKRIPCFMTSDIDVELILPIDTELVIKSDITNVERFNVFSKEDSQGEFVISLSGSRDNVLLEVANNSKSQFFLSELHKLNENISKESGESPNFSWIDKYLTSPSCGDSGDPFSQNQFDPFKSACNNNSVPNSKTAQSSSMPNGCDVAPGFDDNFVDFEPRKRPQTSSSMNSLDSIITANTEESNNAVDTIQRQLGIDPGMELSVGSQPVSARETIVQHYMHKRETEFTDSRTLRLVDVGKTGLIKM